MREILFRGKSKHDGKWAYGYLVNDGADLIIVKVDRKNNRCKIVQVEPETVGQFTDKKSAGGSKIFENDLVFWTEFNKYNGFKKEGLLQVVYDDSQFVLTDGEYYIPLSDTDSCELLVEGNIYDDPKLQLLKGGAK